MPRSRKTESTSVGFSLSSAKLQAVVNRIERVEEERDALGDDLKAIYAEAKAEGFNLTALRNVIKLRKMDTEARLDLEADMDLYKQALGMQLSLDFGNLARRASGEGREGRPDA